MGDYVEKVRAATKEAFAVKKLTEFKVFGVSKNTNSFGLTGMYLVSRKGETFEVAVSSLYIRRVDDIVRLPLTNGMIEVTSGFFFEIPERKPDCPAAILKKIWK